MTPGPLRGVGPLIRFLAITTDDVWGEERLYLFHCDEGWNVIWESSHGGVEEAIRQARWEYGDDVHFEIWGSTRDDIEMAAYRRRQCEERDN